MPSIQIRSFNTSGDDYLYERFYSYAKNVGTFDMEESDFEEEKVEAEIDMRFGGLPPTQVNIVNIIPEAGRAIIGVTKGMKAIAIDSIVATPWLTSKGIRAILQLMVHAYNYPDAYIEKEDRVVIDFRPTLAKLDYELAQKEEPDGD